MADRGIALVTGAAQGLGRATALRLAREGFAVAVNDRAESDALDALAAEVGGRAFAADVADGRAVGAMVRQVERDLGPIEAFVANAAYMAMGPFAERDAADWWRHIDVNLSGTFHSINAVVPGMLARGRGRIVVISSRMAISGAADATAYAASKAGLISLVKSLGRELAPAGVLVNAIAPGAMDTPQLAVDAEHAGLSMEELRRRFVATIPARRIASPDEVAAGVAFLCGANAAAWVGQVLQPNGGATTAAF